MQNSQDFYQKYLTQLIKQVPPYKHNKATIIVSGLNTKYQILFKRYKKFTQKQCKTIPLLYQIAQNLTFIDCGKDFLPNCSNNSRATLLNLLYLFGQIKSLNILFLMPFSNDKEELKQWIKDIVLEMVYCFGEKFIKQKFSQEQQNIMKSTSFLFYNIIGQKKQRMIREMFKNIRDQEEGNLSKVILQNVLDKNKIFYFYEKQGLKQNVLREIYDLEGCQFSEQARKQFFKLNIIEQRPKASERMQSFKKNLNYMVKNFEEYCSLLGKNMQFAINPLTRQDTLYKFEKQVNFNYKNILPLRKLTKKENNDVIKFIHVCLQILKLKKKARELIENHIVFNTKLDEFNLFYELIELLCSWKIITDGTFLQESKIFQVASFVKICSDTFPYISIISEVQVKTQLIIPKIFQTFIMRIVEILQSQLVSERILSTLNLLDQLSQILDKLQQEDNSKPKKERQFKNLFMGGKMIKERIKVIKIHNSFNYFEKMIKFFNRRQKLHWALKCESQIREIDKQGLYLERKSKMLKKIYLTLGEQLKRNNFYFSFKLFQASQSYYSFLQILKHWMSQNQRLKRPLNVKEFLEISHFIFNLGLTSDAKQILYRGLQLVANEGQFTEISDKIDKLVKSNKTQGHTKFLINLSYSKIQLLSEEQIEGVQEVVRQICFE